MNTKPSIDDLLEGALLTLEQVVMPATDDPAAQEQEALIANVLRRVAAEWDTLGGVLYEDNRRLETALNAIADELTRNGDTASAGSLEAVLDAHPYPDGGYAGTRTLSEWNVALKGALVDLIDRLQLRIDAEHAATRGIDSRVRALLRAALTAEVTAAPPPPGIQQARR